MDGVVIGGHSFVDEARITGEWMAAEKRPGAMVYAGSINQSGALEIRADRIGRDTSFGKIIEAVEHAQRSQAPVQRLADRLAGYLVYFALIAAALTFAITRDIRSTIAVIIVAGACGIAAGTPLAILGGIGRCARLGAIVKGGLYLETLGRVDTVVLDKTGTLTFGRPEVHECDSGRRRVGDGRDRCGRVGRSALGASAGQGDRRARACGRSNHPGAGAVRLSTRTRNHGDGEWRDDRGRDSRADGRARRRRAERGRSRRDVGGSTSRGQGGTLD